MKNNSLLVLVYTSFSILLAGCGGGGSNVQSTLIDNFNMTQGVADTKEGATYIQEFLTSQGSGTLVSTMYSRIDIEGLSSVHSEGWTGEGKTISILDSDSYTNSGHGRNVSDIARIVAPGATRNEYDLGNINSSENISTMSSDVITSSAGFVPSQTSSDGALAAYMDNLVSSMESSDAVITIAAQHSNWSGTRTNGNESEIGRGGFTNCSNTNEMTVGTCNSWAVDGLDSDNAIYVGEIDSNNNIPWWSNQAGSEYKNQFLATSSDEITSASDNNPDGNSYAAPRVAGAAALVRHKFPNLTGNQTATVILHTADDLGVSGVDEIYGHGELNIGKALSPVGNLH